MEVPAVNISGSFVCTLYMSACVCVCEESKNNFQMTAANFNSDTYVTYPTIMIATMKCMNGTYSSCDM